MMRHIPKPYEKYRHFKGGIYQILCVARHTESGEYMVVYQALYGSFGMFVRPLDMFMEPVDRQKYPEVLQEFRFELLQEEAGPGQIDSPSPAYNDIRTASVMETEGIQPSQDGLQEAEAGEGLPDEDVEAAGSGLDPLLLEFLDADSYSQRLNILAALHHRITDDMINVMAMATDLEVPEGDVEERWMQLRGCLQKLARFECSR